MPKKLSHTNQCINHFLSACICPELCLVLGFSGERWWTTVRGEDRLTGMQSTLIVQVDTCSTGKHSPSDGPRSYPTLNEVGMHGQFFLSCIKSVPGGGENHVTHGCVKKQDHRLQRRKPCSGQLHVQMQGRQMGSHVPDDCLWAPELPTRRAVWPRKSKSFGAHEVKSLSQVEGRKALRSQDGQKGH